MSALRTGLDQGASHAAAPRRLEHEQVVHRPIRAARLVDQLQKIVANPTARPDGLAGDQLNALARSRRRLRSGII